MKKTKMRQDAKRYAFDEVKVTLRLLGVDVEPVFEKTYLDGRVEYIGLDEFEKGKAYVPIKRLDALKVGQCTNGVMKLGENRYRILQIEMF